MAAVEDDDGKEGKADEDDTGPRACAAAVEGEEEEEEEEAVQLGGFLIVAGVGPPRRVLFLSFRTRWECFWAGAALGRPGFAVAALAHPLELDVAPCMPLRPGRLG